METGHRSLPFWPYPAEIRWTSTQPHISKMTLANIDTLCSKRVLLVDDHALFRGGMKLLVRGHPLVSEVLEAGSVTDALTMTHHTVHLILLDHYMPGLTGINAIKPFQKAFPDATMAIVSGSTSAQDVRLARQQGASGFISKTINSHDMLHALSALLRGQRWFPDEVGAADGSQEAKATLTAKQIEVLAHLAGGLSNRAIAKVMGVSENTVRSHVSAVLYQFNVNSRAEATIVARQMGLVQ